MPRLWVMEVFSLQTASLADLWAAYSFLRSQLEDIAIQYTGNIEEVALMDGIRARAEIIYTEIERRVHYLTSTTFSA